MPDMDEVNEENKLRALEKLRSDKPWHYGNTKKEKTLDQEYLVEFCKYNNIFCERPMSQNSINKISYNFGVDPFYLSNIRNINQLDKIIKIESGTAPSILEDINSELLQMLKLQE
jgi:hypothetical protein